jgi:hypothetical protein
LRYVYDRLGGTRDFSKEGADRAVLVPAANMTGVRPVRGFTLKVIAASTMGMVCFMFPKRSVPMVFL